MTGDSETVLIPGGRDVEATLDTPDGETDACVVACPPHPQMRGHRGDDRLTAVSDYLTARGIACLRFDYGEWDEGYGEREDARNALRWTADRYETIGLFGFSFGGAMAALAAASTEIELTAVALLAPASEVAEDLNAADALDDITCPVLVVYGERDDLADWQPAVDRARELGHTVDSIPGDHFFIGQHDKVAAKIGAFLVDHLG